MKFDVNTLRLRSQHLFEFGCKVSVRKSPLQGQEMGQNLPVCSSVLTSINKKPKLLEIRRFQNHHLTIKIENN
jgi:hypothetical protein